MDVNERRSPVKLSENLSGLMLQSTFQPSSTWTSLSGRCHRPELEYTCLKNGPPLISIHCVIFYFLFLIKVTQSIQGLRKGNSGQSSSRYPCLPLKYTSRKFQLSTSIASGKWLTYDETGRGEREIKCIPQTCEIPWNIKLLHSRELYECSMISQVIERF